MRIIIIFILLVLSIEVNSQNLVNKDSIFVLIDYNQNKNLFRFERNKIIETASIKILQFNKKDKGFSNNEKDELNNDEIHVQSQPNDINYYEFVSKHPPKNVPTINGFKVYNIEDVSKNSKNVWREYPYTIFFIEKLRCNSFNIWEMAPIFQE